MTRIDFYFNLEDKLAHLAQLAEAALPKRRSLMVLAGDELMAQRVESTLCAQTPTTFLPCCRSHHPLAAETPIVIDLEQAAPVHDDILINLRPETPAHFSRFRRVIELVGQDDADKQQARERFRFYRDRGYEIRSHDVTGRNP